MSMMAELNSFSRWTQGKRVNCACRVPAEAMQRIVEQIPNRTQTGGWTQILFADACDDAQRRTLEALGVTQEQLQTPDAYAVFADGERLRVCSAGLRGKIYGLYTILQQAQANDGLVPGGVSFHVPQCPFRGLKVYLPAPDALDEFYKTVDFLLYYRYNTIIVEVGGAMEYMRHPEINESWLAYCREMERYPERADEVQNMFGWLKNSIHFENGGGRWLTQQTVRELVRYCRDRGMEVIPEVPSLSHADYLLNAHPELAERPYDPFPDVYCPSNPASYALLFDVLDEVIDVFAPDIVQIGHDECYSLGLCDRCRGKDPAQLYADDITRIHDYLSARGIRTMLWAEKLLNAVAKDKKAYGGAEYTRACARGTTCHVAATYPAIDRIPKDCIAHNWYWSVMETGDAEFLRRGMEMTFGNWCPMQMPHWQARVDAGARGGALSHWTTLSEQTLQYNGVYAGLVFGTYLQWKTDYDESKYAWLLRETAQELFLYKNRALLRRPHFSILHCTTAERPWKYVTSAPMLTEQAVIGRYVIEYRSGRRMEIPLIYGLNIAHPSRSWALHESAHWDWYQIDDTLCGVMMTTLPVLGTDGRTQVRMIAENPYPEDTVAAVRIEKKDGVDGEIFLSAFAVCGGSPQTDQNDTRGSGESENPFM